MMESVGMQGVEGSDSQYAPEVQMPRNWEGCRIADSLVKKWCFQDYSISSLFR